MPSSSLSAWLASDAPARIGVACAAMTSLLLIATILRDTLMR